VRGQPTHREDDVATTDEDAMLETLEAWLASEVVPRVIELEHADQYPYDMVEQMREFGLFAATIPEVYGGLGLGASAYVRVVEAISRAWMSLTGVINTHLMVAELVRRYGTDEQRAHFLPRLAAAELRGGLALTEPDCGTDLQAVRTTATRTDGVYVLNGTKMWITNAREGNCLAVLVKTDVGAEPRHRGMSLFIVPKDLGYTVPRKLGKLGYKGIDTCEVVFGDVVVPEDHLLGGVEGRGFHQAVGALELGRINIAARGVGVADAALSASLRYAQQRHTMGRPIVEHQAIAMKLADMACRVESARLLVQKAAGAFDRGERCDLEAGMAKLVASEAALENATEAMRIHGAYGYSTEDHVERYYRDAPLLCIGEGTNEIQRITISRQLVSRSA
jgi:alkylation response protein AidB-like acyl-CoA dehydrogenase